MKTVIMAAVAIAFSMMLGACQSTYQKGVSSNYRTQWTKVGADVKTTTNAARAVLSDEGLEDVKAKSTNVDGTATGKKSDGTPVTVAVKRDTNTTSQVSVTVGKIGEPALGAEVAKKIKTRAESEGTMQDSTTRRTR
jgi:Zn-dependent membrane protease YugP